MGLSEDYKAYRLLDVANNKYHVARDVKFGISDTMDMLKRSFPLNITPLTSGEVEEIKFLGLNKRPRSEEADAFDHENPETVGAKDSTASVGVAASVGSVGADVPAPSEEELYLPRAKRVRRLPSRLKDYAHSLNSVVMSAPKIPIPRSYE